MAHWEVSLRNCGLSDVELNRWLFLFDSPACKVTQEEGDNYCLTACRFEGLTDPKEVFKSAKKLKIMMRAFAKIELDVDSLSLDSDDEGDISSIRERVGSQSNIYNQVKAGLASADAFQPTVERRDAEGNIISEKRQERWYDYFIDQCHDWIDSTVVFDALSYFAQKTEVRTVRLTYETVRNDEGGKDLDLINNNWVSEADLKRFICSFNRRDINSPELHAKDASDPKCNMDIAEVKTFLIEKLLKPWLIKKRQRYILDDGMAGPEYLSNMLGI